MILTLDLLTPAIFGAAFAISPLAHILFTLIACLRLLRGGAPTALLLASGRTRRLALLNLTAGFGLMIAFFCVLARPRLESMLIGIAIGEAISFTVFFTLSEKAIKRRSMVLIDLAAAVLAPIALVLALAWSPQITWQAREILFVLGSIIVVAQLAFELNRNRKFRALFSIAGN
jgi:NhaP-type Na+/H+ and K+/H+ antiporter